MNRTLVSFMMFMSVACGSDNAEQRERLTGAEATEIDNGFAADLVKVTYKAQGVNGTEGSKFDYDRSWLQVTNLKEPIQTMINDALNHDPRKAFEACKNSRCFEGGYTKLDANTLGAMGVMVHINAHIARYSLKLLPADGFLVPWSELRANVLAGPVKRLSGT